MLPKRTLDKSINQIIQWFISSFPQKHPEAGHSPSVWSAEANGRHDTTYTTRHGRHRVTRAPQPTAVQFKALHVPKGHTFSTYTHTHTQVFGTIYHAANTHLHLIPAFRLPPRLPRQSPPSLLDPPSFRPSLASPLLPRPTHHHRPLLPRIQIPYYCFRPVTSQGPPNCQPSTAPLPDSLPRC